jgi:hypothetical protein
MSFRIYLLDDKKFNQFFKLSDSELEKIGGQRMIEDKNSWFSMSS